MISYKLQKNRGQAMLTAVIFFLFITMTIIGSVSFSVLRQVKSGQDIIRSKESYYLSEAGVEDIVYRLKTAQSYSTTEMIVLNGYTVDVTVSTVSGGKQISAVTNRDGNVRKVSTKVTTGINTSMSYGVQSGAGTFTLAGGSRITGSVYANGPIVATDGVVITGSATGLTIGGGGYIGSVVIGKNGVGDAWAYSVQGAKVAGTNYCQLGIANDQVCNMSKGQPPTVPYPVSTKNITDWKAVAENGGIHSGDFIVNADTVVLGPKKITGDLIVRGNGVLTVTGTLWVTGSISVKGSSTIALDTSYATNSEAIVADGTISVTGYSEVRGSGQAGSYALLLTTSTADPAISVVGSVFNSTVLNAQYGGVEVSSSANLKAITAEKITIQGGTTINYDPTLFDIHFDTGSASGWSIHNWSEVE